MRQRLVIGLGLILCACAPGDDTAAVDAASVVDATAEVHADDTPVATPLTEVEPAGAVLEPVRRLPRQQLPPGARSGFRPR